MFIKIYTDIQDMIGEGQEWLVKNIHTDEQYVIAKFSEGMLEGRLPSTASIDIGEYTNYCLSNESDEMDVNEHE